MADDTGAKPGGLKNISTDVLQARIDLIEKLGKYQDKELANNIKSIELAEQTLALLANQADAEARIAAVIDKKQQDAAAATVSDKKKLEEQIANLKRVQAEIEKTYNKQPAFYKDLYNDAKDGAEKARGAQEKLSVATEKSSKKAASQWKTAKQLRAEGEKYNISDIIAGGIDLTAAAAEGTIEFGESFEKLSAQTLIFGRAMRGMGMGTVALKMSGMATAIDTSFRGIVKGGVKYTEELQHIFVAALDPVSAEKFGMIAAGSAKKMLNGVGITAEETQTALAGLKSGAMAFRNSFFIDEPEIAAQTANLVAGMQKFGVQTADSIKVIDQMTMSMKKSPAEANKSLKKLTNIAHSLDMNVGKAVKDFTQLMPKIAQFGGRAIDVFADLEAQARATGVGVSELNEVAMKLDTFEGAANAAQQFNAVLGNTFLSVTDLVHAEPADKIEMIKEAMDRSGQSFETAHRRVKNMIASMMGVDVEKAGRIMGSSEDFKTARKEMDKTAMTNEQLKEKIDAQMTSAELLQKQLSRLGGGFAKFVNRSRGAALEASDAMQTGFQNTLTTVGDIEKGVLAIRGVMGSAGAALQNPIARSAAEITVMVQALRKTLKSSGVSKDMIEKAAATRQQELESETQLANLRPAAPTRKAQGNTAQPQQSTSPDLYRKLVTTIGELKTSLLGTEIVNNFIIDGETFAAEVYQPFKDKLNKEFKLTKK